MKEPLLNVPIFEGIYLHSCANHEIYVGYCGFIVRRKHIDLLYGPYHTLPWLSLGKC